MCTKEDNISRNFVRVTFDSSLSSSTLYVFCVRHDKKLLVVIKKKQTRDKGSYDKINLLVERTLV